MLRLKNIPVLKSFQSIADSSRAKILVSLVRSKKKCSGTWCHDWIKNLRIFLPAVVTSWNDEAGGSDPKGCPSTGSGQAG